MLCAKLLKKAVTNNFLTAYDQVVLYFHYLRALKFVTMKRKIVFSALLILLGISFAKADGETTTPFTKKINFGISTTTYPDGNAAKSLETKAETSSLDFEIGLSKL